MKKALNNGTQREHHIKLPTTKFNEKYGLAGPELFWLFFFGSLLGVLMEGVYCKFVHGAWETHVVSIWGPFCILYGIGAVAFYVGNVVWEDKKKWQKFLLFGFLGSGLEVIVGALLEFGLGMYAWDYSEQFMNFRGYVSLSMTLAWGGLGLLFSFAVPRIDAAYGLMQTHAWHIAYVILAVFLTIDLAFTALCLVRWADRKYDTPATNRIIEFIDEKYDDEYMQNRFIEWHPIEWKR